MKLLLPLLLPSLIEHADDVVVAVLRHVDAPDDVIDLAAAVLPEVLDAAKRIADAGGDPEVVISQLREVLDAADDIPAWSRWTESERDELLDAVAVIVRAAIRLQRQGRATPDASLSPIRQRLRKRLAA